MILAKRQKNRHEMAPWHTKLYMIPQPSFLASFLFPTLLNNYLRRRYCNGNGRGCCMQLELSERQSNGWMAKRTEKKSNYFSTISSRRLCFCLKKCVYLHYMKNKCIYLHKNVFYNKSKCREVLAKIGCTKKYVLLQ